MARRIPHTESLVGAVSSTPFAAQSVAQRVPALPRSKRTKAFILFLILLGLISFGLRLFVRFQSHRHVKFTDTLVHHQALWGANGLPDATTGPLSVRRKDVWLSQNASAPFLGMYEYETYDFTLFKPLTHRLPLPPREWVPERFWNLTDQNKFRFLPYWFVPLALFTKDALPYPEPMEYEFFEAERKLLPQLLDCSQENNFCTKGTTHIQCHPEKCIEGEIQYSTVVPIQERDQPRNFSVYENPVEIGSHLYLEFLCMPSSSKARPIPQYFNFVPEIPTSDQNPQYLGLNHVVWIISDSLARSEAPIFSPLVTDVLLKGRTGEENYRSFIMSGYQAVGWNTYPNEGRMYQGRDPIQDNPMDTLKWHFPHEAQKESPLIFTTLTSAGVAVSRSNGWCRELLLTPGGVSEENLKKYFSAVYTGGECGPERPILFRFVTPSRRVCMSGKPQVYDMASYTLDFIKKAHASNRKSFSSIVTREGHTSGLPHSLAKPDGGAAFLIEEAMKREDTLVIMQGDHGTHFGPVHRAAIGFFLNRLPLFSILAPNKWLRENPDVLTNLELNQEKLFSPYDVYTTFLHLVDPKASSRTIPSGGESLSFFADTPDKRSCQEAGIPFYECILSEEVHVYTPWELQSDAELLKAVNLAIEKHQAVIDAIPVENECEVLQPAHINYAVRRGHQKRSTLRVSFMGQYETMWSVQVDTMENGEIVVRENDPWPLHTWFAFTPCHEGLQNILQKSRCICSKKLDPGEYTGQAVATGEGKALQKKE